MAVTKPNLIDVFADPLRDQSCGFEGAHSRSTEKMRELNVTFEARAWNRDHWTENGLILRMATVDDSSRTASV